MSLDIKGVDERLSQATGIRIEYGDTYINHYLPRLAYVKIDTIEELEQQLRERAALVERFVVAWFKGAGDQRTISSGGIAISFLCMSIVLDDGGREALITFLEKSRFRESFSPVDLADGLCDAYKKATRNAMLRERSTRLSGDNETAESVRKVEALRQSLAVIQRTILNDIWRHFREDNKWMSSRWISSRQLHVSFGKQTAHGALCPLGGSVVCEMNGGQNGDYYELTLLGVLLTDQGADVESLLVRYLAFLRDKLLAEPDFASVTNTEVETALGLSRPQSQFLYRLLSIGSLFGGSAGCSPDGNWSASPIHDVDDLPSVPDLHAYLRAFVLRHYDPSLPVLAGERRKYVSGPSRPIQPNINADDDGVPDVSTTPNVEPAHTIEPAPDSLSKVWFSRVWRSKYRWWVLVPASIIVLLYSVWVSLPDSSKTASVDWIVQHIKR